MANNPVDEVISMMNVGAGDADIIRRLTDEGYSPVEISDTLNQAKIKREVSSGNAPVMEEQKPVSVPQAPKPSVPKPMAAAPPMPQPAQKPYPREEPQTYQYPYSYPTYPQYPQEAPAQKVDTETIEEIAEEIVNEKWLEIKGKIADVIEWKEYADKRLNSLDERLKRIELSLDRLQAALLAKVQEYGRDVKNLGAEMSSLENAFGKILNPLVDNVKELRIITEDMKGKKSTPPAAEKKNIKK